MRTVFGRAFLCLGAAFLPALGLLGACSGKHADAGASGDGGVALPDVGHLDEPFHPDASCLVTIDTPPLLAAVHVPIGSTIDWSSNPPSSGPHYPIWAAFKTYSTPVDLGYIVHDLEHGAIVFFYKCDQDGGCADVVSALESVEAALPDDPLCQPPVRVRTVIVPDPLLDVPIAAAAWGWTYKADCVDVPTLTDFAKAHYGQGPEVICANGQENF